MTAWVIRAIEFANKAPCPHAGQYLRAADFAYENGRGWMDWTSNIRQAKHFDSPVEALKFYRTVPEAFPTRPDGQPNRPLTALSINLERIP